MGHWERMLIAVSVSALLCCVMLALAAPAAAAPIGNPRDIDKYLYNLLSREYYHAYKDRLAPIGEHSYKEWVYFDEPPASATNSTDESCWMAAACNILDYEFGGYDRETYKSMIRGIGPHAVQGPFETPWGDMHDANGDCPFFTFDDTGYICQVLNQEIGGYHECIWTTEEFACPGWTGQDPVQWCAERLADNHPVGLMIWWGNAGHRGCHAITLWAMNPEGGGAAGTLFITDSDDEEGSTSRLVLVREVPFTWTGGCWLVHDPRYNPDCHVNWCSAVKSVTAIEPASWGRVKALFRER